MLLLQARTLSFPFRLTSHSSSRQLLVISIALAAVPNRTCFRSASSYTPTNKWSIPTSSHRRAKSTHHHKARSPPQVVHPKPSHPHSVDAVSASRTNDRRSAAQPPPSRGPLRLIRYDHHHPPHGPSTFDHYPQSYAHSSHHSSSSYKASLASRRAPASLFSFHPSATATSTSALPASSSLFASPPTGRATAASHIDPTQAQVPQTASDFQATQINVEMPASASSSSIVQNADKAAAELRQRNGGTSTEGPHSHAHDHAHDHAGHSHGWFGHSHSHAHSEGSAEEADKLLAALKGKGDRGSNITLVGLGANLGLCASKGVAGVYLNSAALLADAAHSLSDMFSDLVTLFCWKMSQKPPSASHPLGYGKYETMGSMGVSLVLVAGALGIGFHSYGLLLEALQPTLQNAPAAIQALGSFTGSIASVGAHLGHDHGGDAHAHDHAHGLLDPNAMWFALMAVVVKEWLYHATLKIAREENSSVLEANALHHRSDSLSSGVTFLAIGGSWLGFPVLDPLGGLLVAGLIGKQGADLLIGALGELSDRGVEPAVLHEFEAALKRVQASEQANGTLLGWSSLRAVKSGVSTFADVTLSMPPETRLRQARVIEGLVRDEIMASQKGVKEIRVHLDTMEE